MYKSLWGGEEEEEHHRTRGRRLRHLVKHVLVVSLLVRLVEVLDLLLGPARPATGGGVRHAEAVGVPVVLVLRLGLRFLSFLRFLQEKKTPETRHYFIGRTTLVSSSFRT